MAITAHIARAVIGGFFIGHGTQKLFGWFGGHGPDGTGQFFESLGMKPGKPNAIAAGAAEAGGGLLFALGTLTPLGATALSSVMVTAIRTAHREKGPWVTEGGWEYNAVLLASVLALTAERSGPAWAFGQLAAGAAGSALAIEAAKQATQAEPAPAEGVRTEAVQQPAEAPVGSTS
jgi:putative oxidoreductase